MNILITGGAGYIGTHTCIELINDYKEHNIIIVDNLYNSKYEAITRVEKLINKKIKFYENDILDKQALRNIFNENKIDSVIHFAGLKAVGESVSLPLKYYENNITGTVILLEVMQEFNCKNIVFSSSATVYGDPVKVPITEDMDLSCTNPYGRTKLFIEYILKDLYKSDNSFNITILRYFNPIGAHQSGTLGEDPNGIPNNLVPYITQVMIGKLKELSVFGNDYNTVDGTGVRDYIHVSDLAFGHVCALNKLKDNPGLCIYNLGTGQGYSVLQVVNAFEKVFDSKIPYSIKPRREGDIASCYADTKKAYEEIGFQTKFNIDEMARDSWRWQKNNPNGFNK